jgi:hypothetical protein
LQMQASRLFCHHDVRQARWLFIDLCLQRGCPACLCAWLAETAATASCCRAAAAASTARFAACSAASNSCRQHCSCCWVCFSPAPAASAAAWAASSADSDLERSCMGQVNTLTLKHCTPATRCELHPHLRRNPDQVFTVRPSHAPGWLAARSAVPQPVDAPSSWQPAGL